MLLRCRCAPLQGKSVLENGIGRATEVEEDADPVASRAWLDSPDLMLTAAPLVKSTAE